MVEAASHKPARRPRRLALLCALLGLTASASLAAQSTPGDLSRLSIEELADIEISSVSKRSEPLNEAAASVYVITGDDIRRSGASTLPEALRLAPNLEVARIDASNYAISARGFNSNTANKLLVLIDGRTVYTPLFSGVFWDAQDVLLPDIDRIEVVSGPGGTLWGSNAVNGVINVITRNAQDSTGELVSLGAGNGERNLAVRYGAGLGESGAFRVYAKGVDRGVTRSEAGNSRQDGWRRSQGGFRFDWAREQDTLTLQGDSYRGSIDEPGLAGKHMDGANLLARWNRALVNGGALQLQGYLDTTGRRYPGQFGERLDTYDIDFQHNFKIGARHELIWGGGYRLMRDHVDNSTSFAFLPGDRTLQLANLFVQDSFALSPRLKLTLGEKLEHNSYTGLESQPSARLAFKLDDKRLLWSAVSRSVRTPSRLDRELFIPLAPPYLLAGGADFRSETLTAYELGYRAQPSERSSYSVTLYYNRYRQLRTVEQIAPGQFVLGNTMHGHGLGIELWGNHQVSDNWRLSAGFSALRQRLGFDAGSRDAAGVAAAGNDPARQFTLRSSHNLPHQLEFDVDLRAVGALPNPAVPGYVTMDARLGWHAGKHLELSVGGRDLLGHAHVESGAAPLRSEIERSVFVNLLWKN